MLCGNRESPNQQLHGDMAVGGPNSSVGVDGAERKLIGHNVPRRTFATPSFHAIPRMVSCGQNRQQLKMCLCYGLSRVSSIVRIGSVRCDSARPHEVFAE